MVYAYFTGIVDYSWDKLKNLNTSQYALLAKTRRATDPIMDRRMRIMCAVRNLEDLKGPDDIELCFKSRHPIIWSFSDHYQNASKYQEHAIRTDWIELIKCTATERILDRCSYLMDRAPEYWKSVVRSNYSRIIMNSVKSSAPIELIRKIKAVFQKYIRNLTLIPILLGKYLCFQLQSKLTYLDFT